MRYNDKGDAVLTVQHQLLQRGYSLPKYGADGHLGDETWGALELYAKTEVGRSSWNPEVPGEVLERLGAAPVPPAPEPITPGPDAVVETVDLRHEQTDPAPKSKVINGKTVLRAPHTVTGIVLHQTACTYGVSQQQIQAAGGDRDLALHRRALNVACHAMAFMDGCLVLTNEVESYIYHGNSFNSYTLGLEVEGRYPGLDNEPDKTTWGGDPTPLTEKTITAAREGIRKLVEMGRDVGMPITDIFSHRQSSATRRSDCGESLWRAVVLDFAVPVLGLIPHQGVTHNDGMPIPKEWDPNGVGQY